jgi:hypothetical protein
MTTGSGSLWKAGICALSLLCLFLGACAKPPVREMREAQRNLDEARAKGAAAYASELYLKAESSLTEAKGLITQKNYEQAKKSAETAAKLALQASVMAETTRASLKDETERMIREAEQGIGVIRAWAPPKNKRKRFEGLRQTLEEAAQGWESRLALAKAGLSDGKMHDARAAADSVLKDVTARIGGLKAMVARPKRGGR